jgi:hypothetical protein
MSEWAWVIVGYATTGIGLAGYVTGLVRRARALQRRTGETR